MGTPANRTPNGKKFPPCALLAFEEEVWSFLVGLEFLLSLILDFKCQIIFFMAKLVRYTININPGLLSLK